ncbi:hypothetical protein EYS09_11430 [Streptomyces kasugaensis]|uniref:Uncharacterized protein n=1 Tax=Streptomyces kasugaensis TaxID=1946 RepID=A0A4Q9HWH7_STRKA|nr:hypothetical protein [Streptomyces kasugaensis]TBO59573.1 hypothetical protein EYS09_11430 [Streptomyces kasugaensis]
MAVPRPSYGPATSSGRHEELLGAPHGRLHQERIGETADLHGSRAALNADHVLVGPPEQVIAAVRRAAGPVMAREVGEVAGVDVSARAKLEPLRSKLVRLVDRGWGPGGGSCHRGRSR